MEIPGNANPHCLSKTMGGQKTQQKKISSGIQTSQNAVQSPTCYNSRSVHIMSLCTQIPTPSGIVLYQSLLRLSPVYPPYFVTFAPLYHSCCVGIYQTWRVTVKPREATKLGLWGNYLFFTDRASLTVPMWSCM